MNNEEIYDLSQNCEKIEIEILNNNTNGTEIYLSRYHEKIMLLFFNNLKTEKENKIFYVADKNIRALRNFCLSPFTKIEGIYFESREVVISSSFLFSIYLLISCFGTIIEIRAKINISDMMQMNYCFNKKLAYLDKMNRLSFLIKQDLIKHRKLN